jgi:DNA modification methylase
VPTKDSRKVKSPSSVWSIPTAPNFKKHIAVFPSELTRIPLRATLPTNGTLLDPFCGSATAIEAALREGLGGRLIGIDVSRVALNEAKRLIESRQEPPAPQILPLLQKT